MSCTKWRGSWSAPTVPTASSSTPASLPPSSTGSTTSRSPEPPACARISRLRAMDLRVTKLHISAVIPTRGHPGDAGLDLYSIEAAHIGPGERWSLGTGIAVEIPEGHAGLVLPRSG